MNPAIRSSRAASTRDDRALRNRFLHGLQIFRAGMQEQMDMRVDQSRHQRAIAEVDDLRAGGMFHRVPASTMRSPWTRTSPGFMMRPPLMSSSRAAWSTMGCEVA